MQIVIDIDENYYEYIKRQVSVGITNPLKVLIVKGIPLPKGHGRLIDADVLVDGMEDDYEFCEAVNATPTIIKADKGDSRFILWFTMKHTKNVRNKDDTN